MPCPESFSSLSSSQAHRCVTTAGRTEALIFLGGVGGKMTEPKHCTRTTFSELRKPGQNAQASIQNHINLSAQITDCTAFRVKIVRLNENKSPNKMFTNILTTPYVRERTLFCHCSVVMSRPFLCALM